LTHTVVLSPDKYYGYILELLHVSMTSVTDVRFLAGENNSIC